MNIINDGLSTPLYQAILRWHSSYQRTGYLSTTSCIDPPRIRLLEKRHDERIIVTATSLLPPFIGTACHNAIDGADETAMHEEEFLTNIEGIVFSGRPDIICHGNHGLEVGDFKFTGTSSYTFTGGLGKDSWTKQANINAWLARLNGYDVTMAWVELIFLDWNRQEAARDREYPPRAVRLYPEILSDQEVQSYVSSRVRLHLDAESCTDEELPLCTPADQWAKEDSWAVWKDGGKRAINGGICATEDEAKRLVRKQGGGHYIQFRAGKRTRCEDFCTVRDFCNQYANEKTAI